MESIKVGQVDYIGVLDREKILRIFSMIDINVAYLTRNSFPEHCAKYRNKAEFMDIDILNDKDRVYLGECCKGKKVYAYFSLGAIHFEEELLIDTGEDKINKSDKIRNKYLLAGMNFMNDIVDGEVYVMQNEIARIDFNMVYFKSGVNLWNKQNLRLNRVVLPHNIIALSTIDIGRICRAERLKLKLVNGCIGGGIFSRIASIEDSKLHIGDLSYCNINIIKHSEIYVGRFKSSELGSIINSKVIIENSDSKDLIIYWLSCRESLIEFHSKTQLDDLGQLLKRYKLDNLKLTIRVVEEDYNTLTNNGRIKYKALEEWRE